MSPTVITGLVVYALLSYVAVAAACRTAPDRLKRSGSEAMMCVWIVAPLLLPVALSVGIVVTIACWAPTGHWPWDDDFWRTDEKTKGD
jgi:uncharacterized BrkB/YihY/UPF0761 family membrane protein